MWLLLYLDQAICAHSENHRHHHADRYTCTHHIAHEHVSHPSRRARMSHPPRIMRSRVSSSDDGAHPEDVSSMLPPRTLLHLFTFGRHMFMWSNKHECYF